MWQWNRTLFGRSESDHAQLESLLANASLSNNTSDTWKWVLNDKGYYKTSIMSSKLDEKLLQNASQPSETVRNKLAPEKIEIFAWRALRRRLPTRVELDKKGIDPNSVRCPICDNGLETIEHSIIFCKFAMEVWVRVFNWWGLGNASTFSIDEVFKSCSPFDSSNKSTSLWQVVKWATSYLIWKYRNHKVYCNKVASSPNVLHEIQKTCYEWIIRRSKKYKFEWNQWFTNPNSCGYTSAARDGVG
ncbi:uncharacterized protein [Rutidosis leptorrhynchoides]|uniref:uncharacterized protein n=1 Tax=Rutidosis leptorrhynchoides TaxID=125765 RepID=UPI003A990B7D